MAKEFIAIPKMKLLKYISKTEENKLSQKCMNTQWLSSTF